MGTWIILGASSAVARAFAEAVAARGDGVVLAGRDSEDLARSAADIRVRWRGAARAVAFDALDLPSHAGFAAGLAAEGGVLNLFVAFGVMPAQAATDADPLLAKAMIDTNFTGIVSVLAAFAPVLEAQRAGCVMVMGSVAGDRGRIGNYLYGATKAALHTWLQGYRARMSRSGVRVVTLKAGVVDTAMTWPLPKLPFMVSPQVFAAAALKAADKGGTTVYAPAIWQVVMTVIRLIPTPIFNKLNI